jgi:hypothetical protein
VLVQTSTKEFEGPAEQQPTPPDRRVPARPVFVDASGRRQRRVRRVGRFLVVPAVGYVALLVSTLLGGPTVNSPYLPLPVAPPSQAPAAAHTARGSHGSDGKAGHTGSGTGSGATRTGTSAGSGTGSGTAAGGLPTAGTTPSAGGAPAPSLTPGAGITHGHSTHTAAPPGASHHPTKKA